MRQPDENAPERIAHILLDVASVFDWDKAEDESDESNIDAMNIALRRLHDPGLIPSYAESGPGRQILHVNLEAMLAGVMLLVHELIFQLTEAAPGTTSHDVIVGLREVMDDLDD